MKIQFRTYSTVGHIGCLVLYSVVVFGSSCLNKHLLNQFDEIEETIIYSLETNVTHKWPLLCYKHSYDDYLCLPSMNKSDNSEKCITYVQLVGSRILPLVSFFLQIYLVQKVFSLNSDCPRAFIYGLYIFSIFTCICMIISIFWSRCYHAFITNTLLTTSVILCILSLCNQGKNAERIDSFRHRDETIAIHPSEKNNTLNRGWEELP
jgi:hypothetical protein